MKKLYATKLLCEVTIDTPTANGREIKTTYEFVSVVHSATNKNNAIMLATLWANEKENVQFALYTHDYTIHVLRSEPVQICKCEIYKEIY